MQNRNLLPYINRHGDNYLLPTVHCTTAPPAPTLGDVGQSLQQSHACTKYPLRLERTAQLMPAALGHTDSLPSKPLSPNLQQAHIQTLQPPHSPMPPCYQLTQSEPESNRRPLRCWRHVGTSASARRGLSSISQCCNVSSYSLRA